MKPSLRALFCILKTSWMCRRGQLGGLYVPVFCYDHIENVPVVYTGDWESGVTYTQGRDNEFFGATDKLIEAWEQLKAEMLQRYPR